MGENREVLRHIKADFIEFGSGPYSLLVDLDLISHPEQAIPLKERSERVCASPKDPFGEAHELDESSRRPLAQKGS